MALGAGLTVVSTRAVAEPVQGIDPHDRNDRRDRERENPDDGQDLTPGAARRLDRAAPTLQERLREQVRLLGGRRALDGPPVLVDECVCIQAEVARVGAQVPLDIGPGGQDVPVLVLEGLQVLPPDLGLALGGVDVPVQARTGASQHLADLESSIVSPSHRGHILAVAGANAFTACGNQSRGALTDSSAGSAPASSGSDSSSPAPPPWRASVR